MDDLADPCFLARTQQDRGPPDVDRLEQLAVPGQRHLRDVVEDDVDAGDGPGDRGGVPDVALHELDVGRPVGGVDQVEHPHPVAGVAQVVGEQGPEVPAAAGHQGHRAAHAGASGRAGGAMSTPWLTHHLMDRRIPSRRATRGS